jgi:uncharacterized protein (DUF362 family)
MHKFSRRDFLRIAALGVGGIAFDQFLSACTSQPTSEMISSQLSTTATQIPPTSQATSPASSQSTTAPTGFPDLAVARNGDPETLVRRALAALGGMENFVPQGANVIIKPNICVASHSYEYAATTNPWVVGALVKLALEAGAGSVKVMDYPFGGTAADAYVNSGIQEQVLTAGGEMVQMSSFKYIASQIPYGRWLKKTEVYEDILNTDVLINVPIAKHHGSARLTLGMKNMLGVVHNRSALHGSLAQAIADLNTLVRPTLTVIDAVRILTAHGPTGGNLDDVKQLDTIIASPDIVAADSYATSLFGLQPNDIEYIQYAAQMGLGRSNLSDLKIEEISL